MVDVRKSHLVLAGIPGSTATLGICCEATSRRNRSPRLPRSPSRSGTSCLSGRKGVALAIDNLKLDSCPVQRPFITDTDARIMDILRIALL